MSSGGQKDRIVPRCGEAAEDCKLVRQMLVALKHTVVSTIGGVDYEGFPTSDINYLQRLRILVEKEQQLTSEREHADRLAEALGRASTRTVVSRKGCWCPPDRDLKRYTHTADCDTALELLATHTERRAK